MGASRNPRDRKKRLGSTLARGGASTGPNAPANTSVFVDKFCDTQTHHFIGFRAKRSQTHHHQKHQTHQTTVLYVLKRVISTTPKRITTKSTKRIILVLGFERNAPKRITQKRQTHQSRRGRVHGSQRIPKRIGLSVV